MAVYTVRKGDTLSGIAKKLGIPNWRTLYEQNKSVIGKNYNLIKPGQKLTYGEILAQSTPAPTGETLAASTPAPTPAGTGAAELATQIAQDQPINFAEVLPWEQYFAPELARGSAEQVYAQYYAPIAQQRQEQLESNFAGRNLIRSGIIDKINKLIPKEKEQLNDSYTKGHWNIYQNKFEEYYKETFNEY